MKLKAIVEGVPPDQQRLENLASDSAEAATAVRKQFEAQRDVQSRDPKLKSQQRQHKQKILTKLGDIEAEKWDSSNPEFQKLAAQALSSDSV